MNFVVTGHPQATTIDDGIFMYLVVEYPTGQVDVFRTVKGGTYEVHRVFVSREQFVSAMPNVSNAVGAHE